jgi:hypothetical protein
VNAEFGFGLRKSWVNHNPEMSVEMSAIRNGNDLVSIIDVKAIGWYRWLFKQRPPEIELRTSHPHLTVWNEVCGGIEWKNEAAFAKVRIDLECLIRTTVNRWHSLESKWRSVPADTSDTNSEWKIRFKSEKEKPLEHDRATLFSRKRSILS